MGIIEWVWINLDGETTWIKIIQPKLDGGGSNQLKTNGIRPNQMGIRMKISRKLGYGLGSLIHDK